MILPTDYSLDSTQDFSHLRDVLGTLPDVKRYIVLCLFFSLDPSAPTSKVEAGLYDALDRLAKAFPWLAGQTIYEDRDESKNHTGVPIVVPFQQHITLITKDLREEDSLSSLSEMEAAKYPFSMLDPVLLVPPRAVSWSSDPYDVTAPILMLQANFIRGGLILTVSGNHTQMDMTGMGIVISLFSKACRDEPFTDEEIRLGNQHRGNAVPLLDDTYQLGPELNDTIVKLSDPNDPKPLKCNPQWAYLHFTASSLTRLKTLASGQDMVPYISTDDAVAAFCWQRISAARSLATTTFARPISVRTNFNLKSYIGHMVDTIYTTLPSPHTLPLSTVAAHLRKTLSNTDSITTHIRALATHLSRLTDKTSMCNGANLKSSRDMVFSSYANTRCCDLSFGERLLGRPVVARRPRMPGWPSLCYMMPRDRDGGIAVAICVRAEELRVLEGDEVLMGFASWVG